MGFEGRGGTESWFSGGTSERNERGPIRPGLPTSERKRSKHPRLQSEGSPGENGRALRASWPTQDLRVGGDNLI